MSNLVVSNISDGTSSVGTGYVVNGSAKAWARTGGTGTPVIVVSLNVSSVTDNGAGNITVNYTSAFSAPPSSPAVGEMSAFAGMQQVLGIGTSGVQLKVHNTAGTGTDPIGHHVSSFGDLA